MRWCKHASLPRTNVCLQEQRKQSFLTSAKENQSPLGLYWNPLTFFFTNPRFVLLICDWNFVLCSPVCFRVRHLSPAHAQRIRLTSSAGTAFNCECAYDSYWKWEKSVYNILNMNIFVTKTHRFTTGGLYSPYSYLHTAIYQQYFDKLQITTIDK